MSKAYVHGYNPRENERLQDQAGTLVDLLHADTAYPPGSVVLEAGCGVGAQTVTLAERSPEAQFISVDVSADSLAEARRRTTAAKLTLGARWMPFPFRGTGGNRARDCRFYALEKEVVSMPTTLTAKLKLTTTPEQFEALRTTQLAYRDALNAVSAYAFAHGKTSSSKRLQHATYATIRDQFGLPAQMACSVPRQVGATYKGLWTKVRKNAEARRKGYTTKRFKGLDQPPHFVSPTLSYVYGHDFSLKTEQRVSLLTLTGRIVVSYRGYSKHMAWLQDAAAIGEAKLWYDRSKKRFYLLVSLTIETEDPTPTVQCHLVGVDVGSRYLATVATLEGGAQFYAGKELRNRADHYARLQKRLQRKGTRSATRRRIAIGQRERRLKLNTNHTISTHILATHPSSVIGLEDLTGVRDRSKRKRGKRASRWAFAELQGFLAYKATLAGSVCIKVDADYTSQTCPRCGYTSRANRPQKGLLFVCGQCQYTLHADLVGARNICVRTRAIWQDWMATGQLSVAPDVTDREAKAVRLRRYAELRWSPVTSSLPSGSGY